MLIFFQIASIVFVTNHVHIFVKYIAVLPINELVPPGRVATHLFVLHGPNLLLRITLVLSVQIKPGAVLQQAA